ncbi:serine threonine- kinase gad8 [Fusarium albosuccineum]|uniref:non-specific serine/threonine protein kinase n=1 Tax=Fusarium albosuccineum TaxID=1237068 RepID=A0A8H4L024_9HYPO|nr:serine threonine- kinase gad8 [Fusarium albosuccineum]
MSWKLAKKLKEAHLDSWSNFSRTPPTSLVSENDQEGKPESSTPAVEDAASSVEGLTQAPVVKTRKPGILVVTLHEGRGFSLPEAHRHLFASHHQTASQTGIIPASPRRKASSSVHPSNSSTRPHTSTSGFDETPTNHGRVSGKYLPYALLDFDKVQVFIDAIDGTPENPCWAGTNTQYKFDVSRVTPLTVHLYVRNPNAPPRSGRSQDIFIGSLRIDPRFDEPYKEVQWVDLQYGTGKLQLGVEYAEPQATKLSIDNFELLKVVGKGSFGKVMQVRKKDTNRIYALKTIRKAKIISRSEVAHTLAERSVLAQINNPFIVPLKFSFQSPEKLYFVLAFVNGGELFHHLTNERRFDINRSRFYTAELLCALECLHGFNVIYRDLKPENILLDYQGHIALCDFGLCKLEIKDEDQTHTFCGTPEYLAPELLLGEGYNKTVDWWTLGVLLYEMLTGLPPFYDEVTNEMYRKILSEPLHFPGPEIVPPAAKDLLTKLLNRKPAERLGANGAAEIKSHPFFHAIDWKKLLQRKYEPAFKPSVTMHHTIPLAMLSKMPENVANSC